MRRLIGSGGLLLAIASASAGCASAPSPIDLTPRFVAGEARTESLMTYATVKTPVADVTAHVGFSWRATVKSVGPEGATIDAQVSRVVVKLPALPAFDTAGSMPLQLLGVGELLFQLMDARFEYVVGPAGRVSVSGWQAALDAAAAKVSGTVPADGSVPTEGTIAETLSRVYGSALPRRPVVVEERWTASTQFHVGTREHGSKVSSSETMLYEGFGELKLPFGGREVKVEGLGIPVESTPVVTAAGEFFLGKVDAQTGRAGGFVVLGLQGDEVLGYWERNELDVTPKEGLLPAGNGVLGAVTSALADLEQGWVFFAGSEWR